MPYAARYALLAVTLSQLACAPPGSAPPDPADAPVDDAATLSDADPTLLPDGAPNPCLEATDCTSCTAITPCGWCGDHCAAGTETQSFDGTCSGETWSWRGVQCPNTGTQCAAHTDCATCAADPDSCGWCANTGVCAAGDSVGPASAVGGCSAASATWFYRSEQCQ